MRPRQFLVETAANSVTSITGTANQVIASAAVGAVTLSLPQSIATSSAVQFGSMGLGAAPAAAEILSVTGTGTIASVAGAVWNAVHHKAATATITGATHVTTAAGFNLIQIEQPTLSAASALTVDIAATLTIINSPMGAGAGPCTVTTAYSLWVQAGTTKLSTTITAGLTCTSASIGSANIATSGVMNFPNNVSVYFRNAANNADILGWSFTNGNLINFGPTISFTAGITLTASAAMSTNGSTWYDSTQLTLFTYEAGLAIAKMGCMFTQTGTVALNNSSSQTQMLGTGVGTLTLPANFFAIGKMIEVEIRGFYTTPASPSNCNFSIQLGATSLASVVVTAPISQTNSAFLCRAQIVCRSTGTAGNFIAGGDILFQSGTLTADEQAFAVSTANTAINTQLSQVVNCTFQTGNALANMTYTSVLATIKNVN